MSFAPQIQGSLDSGCALYAVVNATCSLYNLGQSDSDALYNYIGKRAGHEFVGKILLKGSQLKTTMTMANLASKWLKKEKIGFMKVSSPCEGIDYAKADDWLGDLQRQMRHNATHAFVVCRKTVDHACIIHEVTDTDVGIIDSHDGFLRIPREKFALIEESALTAWFFDPEETILFQKPYK